MSETVVPSSERTYYEDNIDWNQYDLVSRHMNTLIAGDPDVHWMEWVASTYPPFERVLSLNCGTGWVERSLFEHGAVKSVVGVDVSPDSIATARQAAADVGLPAEYVELDTNIAPLPDGPFDLVLNFAALHHVAHIDRVVRGAREVIANDGVLLHYDYTGAHRNQYDEVAWAAIVELNASLPEHLRHRGLCYPHLPTMLVVDPTEAIHSELILETLDRYFEPEVLVPIGGSIAYPLLYQNGPLFEQQGSDDGAAALRRIIDRDVEFTGGDPARATFTFAVMRPRPGALDDTAKLAEWTRQEREREQAAAADGGEYYPRTAFGMVYCDLSDEQMKVLHLTADRDAPATSGREAARVLMGAVRRRARHVGDRVTGALSRAVGRDRAD